MNKVLAQFRRLYDDKGANDWDFTKQENALHEATTKLNEATTELIRASEILNAAAIGSFSTKH